MNIPYPIFSCDFNNGYSVSHIGVWRWFQTQKLIFQYIKGNSSKIRISFLDNRLYSLFRVIYYLVIVAWDLVYIGSSFNFGWGSDTALYFVKNVGGSSNLSNMTQILIPTAISMVIIWFLVWFITHRELNEGVGKASKILIPLLFVLMAFIIIYALTLPGAYIGINALLTPE